MVKRAPLVSFVALFVAAAAVVGLLPDIADLLWGQIVHPPPSQSERVIGGMRDVLFCSSLVLAYLMWLQRRTVTVILCLTCIAIAGLTLLSPLLTVGRYLYTNPVFDPMTWALRDAFPWLFLAALVVHPKVRGRFGEPVPIRFSLRWFLIVAVAHIALFITATSMISVSPNAIETFLTLPGRLFIGLVIRFGAGRWLLDSSWFSTVGPLLEILGSALVWGCVFALMCPPIGARGRQPPNQAMERTADRSASHS